MRNLKSEGLLVVSGRNGDGLIADRAFLTRIQVTELLV